MPLTALTPSGPATLTNKTMAAASNTISGLTQTMLTLGRSTQVNAGTAGGNMYWINLGTIKILWGTSAANSMANATSGTYTWTLPTSFFTTLETVIPMLDVPGVATNSAVNVGLSAKTTTTITTQLTNQTGGTNSIVHTIFVIGT